jgi:hypothetical protein
MCKVVSNADYDGHAAQKNERAFIGLPDKWEGFTLSDHSDWNSLFAVEVIDRLPR